MLQKHTIDLTKEQLHFSEESELTLITDLTSETEHFSEESELTVRTDLPSKTMFEQKKRDKKAAEKKTHKKITSNCNTKRTKIVKGGT